MSDWYIRPCTVCGKPISLRDLCDGPCWHHADVETCRADVESEVRERLRAQVEALPLVSTWDPDGSLSGEDVVQRSDVLSLLGGARESK